MSANADFWLYSHLYIFCVSICKLRGGGREGGGGRAGSMNARYFPHWNLSGESGRVQIASQAYLGIVQNVSLAKSR